MYGSDLPQVRNATSSWSRDAALAEANDRWSPFCCFDCAYASPVDEVVEATAQEIGEEKGRESVEERREGFEKGRESLEEGGQGSWTTQSVLVQASGGMRLDGVGGLRRHCYGDLDDSEYWQETVG